MRALLRLAPALLVLVPRPAEACTTRPTEAAHDYAYRGEAKSYATSRIRVHWTEAAGQSPDLASTRGDGVPDAVAYAAEVGQEAVDRYLDMGFRAIPDDGACGGDEKLDVYLVDFGAADGSTVAECTSGACSSYALVEASFAGRSYADDREGFRTVVTHELFHFVQNAYGVGTPSFWAEGTAQWAMKAVHPELADFERQLPAFFTQAARSIDSPPAGVAAGFLYGAGVWPLYLTLAHGDGLVRDVYETGGEPLAAIDTRLRERGSSLAESYPRFVAWNAATGTLAGTGGYPDAAAYPGTATTPLESDASGVLAGLSSVIYRGVAEGTVTLEGDAARIEGVLVPIEDGKARLDRLAALPAAASGEVLVVVSGVTTAKTDAPYTLRIGAAKAAADGGGCHAAPGAGGLEGLALLALLRRRRRA